VPSAPGVKADTLRARQGLRKIDRRLPVFAHLPRDTLQYNAFKPTRSAESASFAHLTAGLSSPLVMAVFSFGAAAATAAGLDP